MQTEQVTLADMVAGMLTENTGTHFLDSGGDSGRAWQRNQGRAFESEPESVWGWPAVYPHPNHRKEGEKLRTELNPTHNVYHWLTSHALDDYHAEMDKAFGDFAETRPDDHWLALMEDFPEYWARLQALTRAREEYGKDFDNDDIEDEFYSAPTGIYGDSNPFIVNTYNGEDCLSQTLQFCYFEWQNESYVLLQIHGGADVRGGYTRPRAFTCGTNSEMAILDNARAGCGCDRCDARWYTDDAGSHWYNDDGLPELHEMPAMEGERVDAAFCSHDLIGDDCVIVIEQWGEYAPDSRVYCPRCGIGTIAPYFY